MEISMLTDPELFGMDAGKASQVAPKLSENEFNARWCQLEALLGFDAARDVIKHGEVLNYQDGKLREYWVKAAEIRSQMGELVPSRAFYSLENLADFMRSGIDFEGFVPHNYKLLSNMASSRAYLDRLVKDGEVTVGSDEHWTDAERSTGARGGSILKKLSSQLVIIFNDLKLGHPDAKIEFGQRKIVLGKQAQDYVRQIRDYVVNLQK